MPFRVTVKAPFFCFAALIIAAGCMCNPRGYTLYDMRDGSKIELAKASRYPEALLSLDPSTFRILTRKAATLELREFRYNGSLVRAVQLPTLPAYVTRWYGQFTHGLAVSPELSQVAFFDVESGSLKLVRIRDGMETVLVLKGATNSASVAWIAWRSETELVFAVSGWAGERARFAMINVTTGQQVFDLAPNPRAGYSDDNALSESRRYIVYREEDDGTRRRGALKVFDIKDRKLVAHIRGNKLIAGGPCWLGDAEVAYVEGGDLTLYSLESDTSVRLKSFPDDSIVYLVGACSGVVYYLVGSVSGGDKEMYAFSTRDRTERRLRVHTRGQVFLARGNPVLISGFGY